MKSFKYVGKLNRQRLLNTRNIYVSNGRSSVTLSKHCNTLQQTRNINSVNPYNLLTRADVTRLFEEIGSYKEVKEYLDKFSAHNHFAVIKVGGAVLTYGIEELCQTLGFMQSVGLCPIVVHGAGPQVNERLQKQAVTFDYINGQRVTTPEILSVVREVLYEQNQKLVQALEDQGSRARPLMTGVFTAECLPELGLVGQITNVNSSYVEAAIRDGCIPILTCLASTKEGNALNVNADFAAFELSKKMCPLKVVWISNKGGLVNDTGEIIDQIDLSTDYDELMNQSWFKHGDKLKLQLIKDLLEELPRSSSVSITSPEKLSRELFTHKGAGTLICYREHIDIFRSLDEIDLVRARDLLEDAFQGKLDKEYFNNVKNKINGIYLSRSYSGIAIILNDNVTDFDILDKFAVRTSSSNSGMGARLLSCVQKCHPKLLWRAKKNNIINTWYFSNSSGVVSIPGGVWSMFWSGEASLNDLELMANRMGGYPPDFTKVDEEIITENQPLFPSPNRKKIGLLGARGHVGNEFTKLLDKNNEYELTVVGSRRFEGRRACDVLNTKYEVNITNITPEHIVDKSENLDAWILAMPNKLAHSYVLKIPPEIKIIDLSSDFRFEDLNIDMGDLNWKSHWQYGLPEKYRERIQASTRIANPGCYASAAQLALLPIINQMTHHDAIVKIVESPNCFGISGYSGAGTTPSDKNDIAILKDNIIPYSLVNHIHEREISHQFSNEIPLKIHFSPHVASFFRGINMTISFKYELTDRNYSINADDLYEMYSKYYQYEPFVNVMKDVPYLTSVVDTHLCTVGGFHVDEDNKRIVITSVLDNLLKGAASVCMQNLNLCMGVEETLGLTTKLLEQELC